MLTEIDQNQSVSSDRTARGAGRVKVALGVLTFKRPMLLRACLASLLRQTLLADPAYEIWIAVVDNDAGGSAAAEVREIAAESPVPIRYAVESGRGVARGRNRVFEETQGCDLMAMLDDDETAAPDWLENLVRTQRVFSADVVTGPVDAELEIPALWVVQGGFFSARKAVTGSRPRYVETNNVLFTGEIVSTRRFDLRFNMTGGEDTHFFYQLMRQGARAVWCESARVKESIPAARTTPEWLVNRAYSNADRLTGTVLCVDSTAVAVWNRLLRATASLCIGLCLYAASFGSVARNIKARQRIARFRGTVDALRGRRRIYYQNDAALT